MYDLNCKYQLHVEPAYFFTGTILEENETHVKILTPKDGLVIVKKDKVIRARKIEDASQIRKPHKLNPL